MRKSQKSDVRKWLLICFPYGLYLMWNRKCSWHVAAKTAVSLGFACAVAVVMLLPSPDKATGTYVEMIGIEPDAKVFGPGMPEGYDMDEYVVPDGGADLIAPEVVKNETYVYLSATEGSTYYHDGQCQYAYASSPKVTLYEAHLLGYDTPCGICNPPLYDPATDSIVPNANNVVIDPAQ